MKTVFVEWETRDHWSKLHIIGGDWKTLCGKHIPDNHTKNSAPMNFEDLCRTCELMDPEAA